MDSAFIYRAANELVQNAGTRNIKQIARSCSLDISETSRIKDMLGLLSLYFDKPLILDCRSGICGILCEFWSFICIEILCSLHILPLCK